MYCAIIGDIVDSRKVKDRQALQDRFAQALDALNREYDACLASNLTVTLGDECQGLLNVHYLWYEVIQRIRQQMAPIPMRFGVGIGEMATHFEKHTSVGADGPPYWHARKMLDELKSQKGRNNRCILFHSGTAEDLLINALLLGIETIRAARTDKQTAAVRAMARYRSQEAAAQSLGINQSAVSQRLRGARYYEVREMENTLIRYLKQIQY
jgi:hypothetical protein